eukprot:15482516-Alexandrium_andersonii.AAC.1
MPTSRSALGAGGVADSKHDQAGRHRGAFSSREQGGPSTGMRAKEDTLARIVHQSEGALKGGIDGKGVKQLAREASGNGCAHLGVALAAARVLRQRGRSMVWPLAEPNHSVAHVEGAARRRRHALH